METVSLSWQNDRKRGEFTARPGHWRLVVDRLQRVDADGEGRLLRATMGSSTWRRSYADRYIEIRGEEVEGERFHIPYAPLPHDALSIMLRVRTLLQDARNAAARQPENRVVQALDRILGWDADRLADDGDRFRRVYTQLGPLPPDQQMAVVLQPRDDFEQHVASVLTFLGAALPMRHGVYIDGNVTPGHLCPLLDVISVHLPGEPISAAVPTLSNADWPAMRRAGLVRVYVSLEGGEEAAYLAAKQSGVALSLLLPAPPSQDDADAAALRVNTLPLDDDDTVYAVEPKPFPYDVQRRLTLRRAFHHFRAALRFEPPPAGPVVGHYPLMSSVY